jgi:hypothetical protein
MKMRRLSEIDLARIAPLPTVDKYHRLRELKDRRPPHTYNPTRANVPDLLNVQPPMFPRVGYTNWETICRNISKKAKSESEEKFNLEVSRALYDFGKENAVLSYEKSISEWSVGYGQTVRYWWSIYTVIGRDPLFLFVDPRLSSPLTRPGIRFALSIMHERIRVPDPDFANAKLAVCQFPRNEEGVRKIHVYDASEFKLYDVDQLNEMIDETYRIWAEVLAEREAADRKATGTTPLGF